MSANRKYPAFQPDRMPINLDEAKWQAGWREGRVALLEELMIGPTAMITLNHLRALLDNERASLNNERCWIYG